jgi:hypothetical protein
MSKLAPLARNTIAVTARAHLDDGVLVLLCVVKRINQPLERISTQAYTCPGQTKDRAGASTISGLGASLQVTRQNAMPKGFISGNWHTNFDVIMKELRLPLRNTRCQRQFCLWETRKRISHGPLHRAAVLKQIGHLSPKARHHVIQGEGCYEGRRLEVNHFLAPTAPGPGGGERQLRLRVSVA